MNDERKKQIVAKLNSYLKATGKSANAMAVSSGVSAATLSNMRNGIHEQISPEMWRKVQATMIDESWTTLETKNFATIQSLLKDTQETSRMVAISDYTGAGKTTALEHYQSNNANVFYLLTNCFMSQIDLIDAILKSIGVLPSGNKLAKILKICEKLKELPKPMLILDDFGKVSDLNFRILQLLYDQTERRAAIVIAGVEKLKDNLERNCRINKMGFKEIQRRISFWQALERPSLVEKKNFVSTME